MAQRVSRVGSIVLAGTAAIVIAACGGGTVGESPPQTGGKVTGLVVKGPVSSAAVTAYAVDHSGVRGASIATSTSAVDGTFSLSIPPYNGDLELVATGGTYVEEAVGTSVNLTRELTALVVGYKAGDTVSVTLSPVSTIARGLALAEVARGSTLASADANAWNHVNAHFGALDWRRIVPVNVAPSEPVTVSLSNEAKAGLILAALSQAARNIAESSSLGPATSVTAATLTGTAADDANDGTLDGSSNGSALYQGKVAISRDTYRRGLGLGLLAFARSPANRTNLTATDVYTLANALASNDDPYLFCARQTGSCPGSTLPAPTPPVITVAAPGDGSYLHGKMDVRATVTGTSRIAKFAITEPPALVGIDASYSSSTLSATIDASLDLGAYADGPLALTFVATDDMGISSKTTVTIHVAASAPNITVNTPQTGNKVKGWVDISADAAAQNGASVASFTLVDPPGGVGPDIAAAPGTMVIRWDTTLALEGPVALHFRAIDTTGLVSDKFVNLEVDNVPLGKIDVYVLPGAPIKDAWVEVWALDDATGLVSTSYGSAGLLGSAGPTDDSGHVLVTLSGENYAGPIKIVAKPATGATLSYLDPSYPSAPIQIPTSLPLTSVVPQYVAGNAIAAPVTLWTTLADAELVAYATGAHRLHPTKHTVSEASKFSDGLFAAHFQTSPSWRLRSTVPVVLTAAKQTLSDQVYAALPDTALAQLAREMGVEAQVNSVITAPYLIQLLQADLAADGQFDGLGAGGAQLKTAGIQPLLIDTNTLRSDLAIALDDWIRSANNMTGLGRSALDGAGIYAAVSNDVSELFGAATPVPFDSAPPATSITITYGPSNSAPVTAGSVVRGVNGTIKVTVTASDDSGVGSITLRAGNTPVQGTLSLGATNGTLVATFDTRAVADGLLTLTATVTDTRSNSGTATSQVTIDNTGPDIDVRQPVGGAYYNGAIPMEAIASDTRSGVASCTETTTGVADGDGVAERYTGTLTPSGGDGQVTLSFQACDVVGNCTTRAATTNRDVTAPTVSVQTAPPRYTNSTGNVSFGVVASDRSSGVTAVYAQQQGFQNRVTGTWNGSSYWFEVPLNNVGPNAYDVWAVDAAGNGALGSGVTVATLRDNAAPVPSLNAAVASYYDERCLYPLTSDATPVPATAYSFDRNCAAAKLAVGNTGAVWKASSRLYASTSAPTAAVLEDANPDNIPFLQYQVPTAANTSPLAGATYSISVNGGSPITGDLTRFGTSPSSTAEMTYYDLPLSADIIPDLASATGSVTLSISVTVSDAAGNPGTTPKPFVVTFNFVGPPLYVHRDGSYGTYGDPKSTFPYYISNQSYSWLWNDSTKFPAGVRLLRYVVSNPSPVPVALNLAFSGTSHLREFWVRNLQTYVGYNNSITINGIAIAGQIKVSNEVGRDISASGCAVGSDCSAVFSSYGTSFHREPGDQYPWGSRPAHEWTNAEKYVTPNTDIVNYVGAYEPLYSSFQLSAFLNPSDNASETQVPPSAAGLPVVPAASGATPGRLVVYVARPWVDRSVWINSTAYTGIFESVVYQYSGIVGGGCCGYRVFDLWQVFNHITGAEESIDGTFSLTTQPVNGTTLTGSVSGRHADAVSDPHLATH